MEKYDWENLDELKYHKKQNPEHNMATVDAQTGEVIESKVGRPKSSDEYKGEVVQVSVVTPAAEPSPVEAKGKPKTPVNPLSVFIYRMVSLQATANNTPKCVPFSLTSHTFRCFVGYTYWLFV